VPTLDGRVNIRVPAGTQNGQKLRVRGRGLPRRNGVSGDLIVVMEIEMPKRISESERKLWEELARHAAVNRHTQSG
jgi:curved DNA-binding protein